MVYDCPAGLEPNAGARNSRKANLKYTTIPTRSVPLKRFWGNVISSKNVSIFLVNIPLTNEHISYNYIVCLSVCDSFATYYGTYPCYGVNIASISSKIQLN